MKDYFLEVGFGGEEEDDLISSDAYRKYLEEELAFGLTTFEKLCKFAFKVIRVKSPPSLNKKWEDPLYMAGLRVNGDEIFSLAILSFIISFILIFPILIILGFPGSLLFLLVPPFVFYNVISYPEFYSDVIRIKAGNETVNIILYMVIYLSLNPVYEKAVEFTAINTHGPLGLDLKKILWDVKMGKFPSVKEAIGEYSKKWSLWNDDFVTSLINLQLIALQPTDEGRNEVLKESLERTLRSTYIKMEDYALSLNIPSKIVLFLGIMLPMMGLIMFPLASIFLSEVANPLYVALGYIIFLPAFLTWYLYRLISKRPAAFSHSQKAGGVKPAQFIELPFLKTKIQISVLAFFIGALIALPGFIYYTGLISKYMSIYGEYPLEKAKSVWRQETLKSYGFVGNKPNPYAVLAHIIPAAFLIWGVAIGVVLYTRLRSKDAIKMEEFIRKLESEFEMGLFELQTALAQNIPMEVALPTVMERYERMNKKDSPMYVFFERLYANISQMSMSITKALFDEKEGILKDFPSSLIKDVMKIVASSVTKSPKIASNALKNIVLSLKRTNEIEHMIKNLLEEIVSNLKMLSSFITPFICGIVAATSILIIQLLQAITNILERIEMQYNFAGIGTSLSKNFKMILEGSMMPPTVMEFIVGMYVIEIIIIMCFFLAGIQRGFDEVSRDYFISQYLLKGIIFYSFLFIVGVLAFQPVIINALNTMG